MVPVPQLARLEHFGQIEGACPVSWPNALLDHKSIGLEHKSWSLLLPSKNSFDIRQVIRSPGQRRCFPRVFEMIHLKLAAQEQSLKWVALTLGVLSTVSIVQDWQLAAMVLGLPFCLIWIYCGWLRTEPQLKYINIVFSALYIYGIARYFFVNI